MAYFWGGGHGHVSFNIVASRLIPPPSAIFSLLALNGKVFIYFVLCRPIWLADLYASASVHCVYIYVH